MGNGLGLGIHEVLQLYQEMHFWASRSHQAAFGMQDTYTALRIACLVCLVLCLADQTDLVLLKRRVLLVIHIDLTLVCVANK